MKNKQNVSGADAFSLLFRPCPMNAEKHSLETNNLDNPEILTGLNGGSKTEPPFL